MGWRGDDNRDLANERDSNRHPVQLTLFAFAVLLLFAVWITASIR